MKTRAVLETQPEQDSLTGKEQTDSNKDISINDDSINNDEIAKVESEKNATPTPPNEKAQQQDSNNNVESEPNKNVKSNRRNIKNDVDNVGPKSMQGILSTSKHKVGNGRMGSPGNSDQRDLDIDNEPGKASSEAI